MRENEKSSEDKLKIDQKSLPSKLGNSVNLIKIIIAVADISN